MAKPPPSPFVDPATGTIVRFQTLPEKFASDYLPGAAHVGLLGIKLAMLAPFVGGLAVAAPVALGAWLAGRWATTKLVDLVHERVLLSHTKTDFIAFDFSKPEDRRAFDAQFGKAHPRFVADYLAMTEMARLGEVPKVLVVDQFFKKAGPSKLGGLVSDYMAGTTSRPTGKDPVIMLGKGALKELNADELRAVMAHEMTHLNLAHPARGVRWLGRMPLNSLLNIGLVAAAVFGPLPFMPVLGIVLASNVVGTALKSLKSRQQEDLCDRGAALITGGTGSLASALEKIKESMLKMKRIETEYSYRAQGLEPPAEKPPGWWSRFVNASHPANAHREKRLARFEEKYPDWCLQQRGKFSAAFNEAAAKAPPAAAPAVPLAPQAPIFKNAA